MANITINFTSNVATTDPLGAGCVITEFGGNPVPAVSNTTWQNNLVALAPGHCRFSLAWYGGNPSYGAGGSPRQQGSGGSTATALLNTVKNTIGAIPLVSFNGDSSDNNFVPADGGSMVHFFNDSGGQHGGRIQYWSIGNEADNGGGTATYESASGTGSARAALSAMLAADSTITVGLPAAAYWDTGLLSWAAGVPGVGGLSYHAYDGGNTDGSGFPTDPQMYNHIKKDLHGYKSGIMYGVEEVNWNPAYTGQSQFYDWHNTCFIADNCGQALSAGGHMTVYGDSNGALGLMNDGSGGGNQPGSYATRFPAYWGLGIWTGMNGQFKRWSAHMVSATTTFSQGTVTVFACDNGKIVVVNKGASSQALSIAMTLAGGATAGTYNIWATQYTSPTGAIREVVTGSAFSGSTINYTIPAGTAISIDVTATGGGGGTPGSLTQPGGVAADQFLTAGIGPYVLQLNEWNSTQAYSVAYTYTSGPPAINAPPPPAGYTQTYYHDFTTGGIGDWTAVGDPGGIGGVSGSSSYAVSSSGLGVTLNAKGDTIGLWSPSAQVVPNSFIQAYVYLAYTGGQIANWPDFWCVGATGTANNSTDGEIDLCEGLGGQVCWHTHSTPGSPGGGAPLGQYLGWHYYSCQWTGNAVTFWYDNTQVASGVSLATTNTMTLQFGTSAATSAGLTPWGSQWYGGPALVPSTIYLANAGIWTA